MRISRTIFCSIVASYAEDNGHHSACRIGPDNSLSFMTWSLSLSLNRLKSRSHSVLFSDSFEPMYGLDHGDGVSMARFKPFTAERNHGVAWRSPCRKVHLTCHVIYSCVRFSRAAVFHRAMRRSREHDLYLGELTPILCHGNELL